MRKGSETRLRDQGKSPQSNLDQDNPLEGEEQLDPTDSLELEYTVDHANDRTRLDVFLTAENPQLTRSHVQKLIAERHGLVNGQAAKSSTKLQEGDIVTLTLPPVVELAVEGQNIPLDILYEDSDVIVINKPQGMVVHPAPGNLQGTLVNALLYHCQDLSGINGVMRPGIVHRLDKDTSGVMMAAKNEPAHLSLAGQIKDRSVVRRYIALVHGNIPEPAGVVDAPIGRDELDRKKMAVTTKNSKSAVTRYTVLERYRDYTLVECKLETGRTHQIRVHMAYLGHPVVGDPKYGTRKAHFNLQGQALHAAVLGFKHPVTGDYLEFTSPIPQPMAGVIEKLRQTLS
ncbi:MAG TPA: RluA family pseudouridine synthase [Bacillota bacterium]|nr:RluA family pseudouridine synthase [Bacillota bacterium]